MPRTAVAPRAAGAERSGTRMLLFVIIVVLAETLGCGAARGIWEKHPICTSVRMVDLAAIGICAVIVASEAFVMKRFYCHLANGKFVVMVLVLAASVGRSDPSSSTPSSVNFPRPAVAGLLEKWSNGSVIRWRVDTVPSDPSANLQVYDRTGTLAFQQRFWLPDAEVVKIHDVQQSSDGRLGLAGLAFTATGQGAGFVSTITLKSGAVQVVQTSPFEPQRLVFAGDGALWAMGFELSGDRKISKSVPHSTLRRYDRNGKQLGQFLPWPATACGVHPAILPRLFSTTQTVGILLQACNEWIEFTTSGQASLPVAVPDPSGKKKGDSFHGMAMTADGEVYTSFSGALYHLNRSKWVWDPILPPSSAQGGLILGSDGQSIVLRQGDELVWQPITE